MGKEVEALAEFGALVAPVCLVLGIQASQFSLQRYC